MFLQNGRVRIAFWRAPFSFLVCDAKVESLADDWVGTGVCKLSSSLCCYDWLSMSAVLSIRFLYLFDMGLMECVFDRTTQPTLNSILFE